MKEKRWKTWKSNQKIVMGEELVHNGVMVEKFVKNFVMCARIGPKVEYGQIVFKIVGSNIRQLSNRKLSEGFMNESEPRLSIRIPSRDSFLMTQYLERPFVCGNSNVKESKWQNRLLMLLCCGLCEWLATLQRQHFVASNDLQDNPRRHLSWKDSVKTDN